MGESREEIYEKVKAVIVEQLGAAESEVTEGASFTDDLGADSLDTVELVMAFEDEFGTEIQDDQAEQITTIKQTVNFILEHQGKDA